jgi:hypothetical protein
MFSLRDVNYIIGLGTGLKAAIAKMARADYEVSC